MLQNDINNQVAKIAEKIGENFIALEGQVFSLFNIWKIDLTDGNNLRFFEFCIHQNDWVEQDQLNVKLTILKFNADLMLCSQDLSATSIDEMDCHEKRINHASEELWQALVQYAGRMTQKTSKEIHSTIHLALRSHPFFSRGYFFRQENIHTLFKTLNHMLYSHEFAVAMCIAFDHVCLQRYTHFFNEHKTVAHIFHHHVQMLPLLAIVGKGYLSNKQLFTTSDWFSQIGAGNHNSDPAIIHWISRIGCPAKRLLIQQQDFLKWAVFFYNSNVVPTANRACFELILNALPAEINPAQLNRILVPANIAFEYIHNCLVYDDAFAILKKKDILRTLFTQWGTPNLNSRTEALRYLDEQVLNNLCLSNPLYAHRQPSGFEMLESVIH